MLRRGKHASPEDGACVVELASILADEPFSDAPESVCPVIAGFLRGYNDSVDDELRQDLYGVAAKVVGSRASSATERARGERLREWDRPRLAYSIWRRLFQSRSRSPVDPGYASTVGRSAGRYARKYSRASHVEVLALVDELVAIGQSARDVAGSPRVGSGTSAPVDVRVPNRGVDEFRRDLRRSAQDREEDGRAEWSRGAPRTQPTRAFAARTVRAS
jgi:hypothetical protein